MCPYEYYTIMRQSKDPKFLRLRMVQHALTHSLKDAARVFKTTVNTVRKWVRRFDGTMASLAEQSRAPHKRPRKLDIRAERKIVALKKRLPRFSARRLKYEYDLPWAEACKCGFREAKEVVYIGDGAAWICSEQQRHFAKATFIIDWFHASEHVWDCGKTLLGEGTAATRKWVAERLSLLWDGWTKKLLDDLKKQHKQHRGAKREALADLIRYIGTNEEQMRYDVFRNKGYKIGSGAVEGACKHVVGKRLKQSRMIWSREGSAATLALRVIWLNGRWERLWKTKPLAA